MEAGIEWGGAEWKWEKAERVRIGLGKDRAGDRSEVGSEWV